MNFLKNLKINKKKSTLLLSIVLLVFVGVLGDAHGANAALSWSDIWSPFDALGDAIQRIVLLVIGFFLQLLILLVGTINVLVIETLITIASYNNFINEPSIVMAWAVIRDFCNMFFILILLVIAFATILRIESYNMKKWLPKLLIMAVLINFSRTIAGLIIDFSQVFMLTFVSAIGTTGGSIIDAMGIQKYFTLALTEQVLDFDGEVDFNSTLLGLFLGTIFLIIATVVLGVFLAVLVVRTVMLWIYVVLSPLAFLLAAFPGGQKYSTRWWDEFIKQVITGPILMFFFWLALITSSGFEKSSFNPKACFGVLEAVCPDMFLHYVLAIGMLMGGLIITSQAGGAAGGIASKGMGAINKGKSFALNKAGSGAARAGKATGRTSLGLARGLDRNLGSARGMEGGLIGTGMQKTANLAMLKPITNKFKQRRENKERMYKFYTAKKEAEKFAEGSQERTAAFAKLEYEDATGKKHKYHEQNGFTTTLDGGKKIKEMKDGSAKMYEGSYSANSNAWAAKRAAEDKKIDEEAAKLKQSGTSEEMLHKRAKDKALSEDQRKGAALALGLDADFIGGKSHEEVKEMRDLLGGNQILQKKFDDSLVKKHAHNLYGNSAEGQEKLKKAIKRGKTDEIMDKSFYSDEVAMKTFEDATGSSFVKKIKKAADHDDDIKDSIVTGLKGNMEKIPNAINGKGLIEPVREAMVAVTGDLSAALKGVSTKEQMEKGVESLIGGMATGDRAKIKFDSITAGSNGVNKNIDTELQSEYIMNVNQVLSNKTTSKHLEIMDRTEGKDMQTIKYLEKLVKERSRTNNAVNQNSSQGHTDGSNLGRED
ncbi:MAG: hypothetical protein PF572_05210 [Patescibacteria group bacterium]|jgi:hypothetical protein|nr:hypothetical protein [Patescibacteria group bacterium]